MPKWLEIALKDVRVMVRDKAALLVMLAFPSALILILGLAFGGLAGEAGLGGIPVAIVNHDQGKFGSEIVDTLTGDEQLSKLADMRVAQDAEEVRAQVERGDLVAALIIPADFSAAIEGDKPTSLEVLQDPGSDITASVWAGIVRSLASRISASSVAARAGIEAAMIGGRVDPARTQEVVAEGIRQAQAEGGLTAVTVTSADAEQKRRTNSLDYYAASMTSMFLLFGCMFGAFSFVGERESKTLARLLTSQASRGAIVGGKLFAVILFGLGQFTVLYLFTRFSLKAYWGNVFGVFAIVTAELIATVGLAALVSSFARTRRAVGGIAPVIVQLSALIGGAFFPVFLFPEWLRPVQYLSVVGWSMDAFVKLQNGATISGVLSNAGAMVAIGVVLTAFGAWRLRYE